MVKRLLARAPSNIALLKYMGKARSDLNVPAHGSLSMTLQGLASYAEVTQSKGNEDRSVQDWPELLSSDERAACGLPLFSNPAKAQEKVLKHVALCREVLSGEAWAAVPTYGVEVRCVNGFPTGAGIASSASSLAAITLALAWSFAKDPDEFREAFSSQGSPLRAKLADLSRRGSGSSCRSFMGPWVEWNVSQEVSQLTSHDSPLRDLVDLVLVVDDQPKLVSSSDAHLRVTTSPLWNGRVQRAEDRLSQIRSALQQGSLESLAQLAWAEAWEMHSLFHTAQPPFSYWTGRTMELLQWFSHHQTDRRFPVLTLDAGPNIHLLARKADCLGWKERLQCAFPSLTFLSSESGAGAEVLRWTTA